MNERGNRKTEVERKRIENILPEFIQSITEMFIMK